MPPEALRATDPIHRKIEEVFGNFGLFYDRRKGHYKDLGKPAAKIVSVREVLQATLAIALRRPDEARGRPADYLKDDKRYAEIYGTEKIQVTTYLRCIELVRRIEALKPAETYKKHAYNLLYYVVLCVACRAVNNAHVPVKLLNDLKVGEIDDGAIVAAYDEVFPIYQKAGADDKAAKGNDLREALVAHLEKSIHGNIAARRGRRRTRH